eukprot:277360_1
MPVTPKANGNNTGDSQKNINPNSQIESVIKIFPDSKPQKKHKNLYFSELVNADSSTNAIKDSIAVVVPFYNEPACEIHATLRSLHENFQHICEEYKPINFNVLLVGDGWSKADLSTKIYLTQLYNCCTNAIDDTIGTKSKKNKDNHN